MPYNKPFLKYIVQDKIINGSPKFKLYQYNSSTGSYNLIKELPASCEYIETTTDIGAQCTATDTSSDSYTVDRIELHVNTYRYAWGEETYSDTKIDAINYSTSKTGTGELRIVDKVTFTSAGYAEVRV